MSAITSKDQLLATLRESRARWDAQIAGSDLLDHVTVYHRTWGAHANAAVTDVPVAGKPTPLRRVRDGRQRKGESLDVHAMGRTV